MIYRFKCYKENGKGQTVKRINAEGLDQAYALIDEWCYSNGYIDFELVED